MSPTGVLVLSHGTPGARDDVEAFYTRIRHGHPPTEALLDDLVRRYDAIGGLSPLAERTAAQVRGLAIELADRGTGSFVVEGATKYATPSIEESTEKLVAAGATPVIGLVLSPLNAPSSTDAYHRRAEAALSGRTPYLPVWSWWDAPGFAQIVARRVRDEVERSGGSPTVAFTAHSLPARVPGAEEYGTQLALLAGSVAEAAGLDDHLVCWQSAGRTNDEWLGPDLLEVLASLDPKQVSNVVVCPVGFVSDHLEVLYDVDIEAERAAASRGISLRRTSSLNDDADFLAMLATLVESVASAA
jgi:protoporphyrin/coproporphyrin ferrochelatase